MKKAMEEFVFEELEKVDMPNRYIQRSITITNGAELIINKKFLEELVQEHRELKIDLRQKDNYSVLAFKVQSDGDFIIPKNGRIKHRELYGIVKSFGYEIPARYIFEKDDKTDTWIGCLEEVTPAPCINVKGGKKTRPKQKG